MQKNSLESELASIRAQARQFASFVVSGPKTDRKAVTVALAQIYDAEGLPEPTVIWCQSPIQLYQQALLLPLLFAGNQNTFAEVKKTAAQYSHTPAFDRLWGQVEKQNVHIHVACHSHLGRLIDHRLKRSLESEISEMLDLPIHEINVLLDRDSSEFQLFDEPEPAPTEDHPKERQWQNLIQGVMDAFERAGQPNIQAPDAFTSELERLQYAIPLRDDAPHATISISQQDIWQHSLPVMNLHWLQYFDCLRHFQPQPHPSREKLPAAAISKTFGRERRIAGGKPFLNLLENWMQLVRNGFMYLMFENFVLVCNYPEYMHLDEETRLHGPLGPAVEFADGGKTYAWHGTIVPADLIDNQGKATPWLIGLQPNIELRRIMIDIYGIERFLKDSGAKKLQKDKFGTLYRKDLWRDEPLVYVQVINSSPEPDGTFRKYFLRVPPETKTAKEGVAWSFGLSESAYGPDAET